MRPANVRCDHYMLWCCLVGVPDLPSSVCSLCLRWNTSTWQWKLHVGIFIELHDKQFWYRFNLSTCVKHVSNGVPEAGMRVIVLPPKLCEWNAAPARTKPTKYISQKDNQALQVKIEFTCLLGLIRDRLQERHFTLKLHIVSVDSV